MPVLTPNDGQLSPKTVKPRLPGTADSLIMQSLLPDELACATPFCPLSRIKAGVVVRIKQLCANEATAQRLREIGLCEEQLIRLLTAHTNIICQVCTARLALSPQLAETILVEPISLDQAGRQFPHSFSQGLASSGSPID